MMSSEGMVSFLRKVAPGVEQSLQQNETVDIFQVEKVQHSMTTVGLNVPSHTVMLPQCHNEVISRRTCVVRVGTP